jgi:D-glycero-alpha-D-manno-heptose-7-phosphate kinase
MFYKARQMFVSRTPFRISLFGGGTDYPAWIAEHGGAVLGMAINKYCLITVRSLPPFFDYRHRITYSRIEIVKTIDEIQHPAVRACFQEMGVVDGIEVQHGADLPARSGLGSSSSFTVGLLHALYALRGIRRCKRELALDAIHIEQQVIGESVGCQDQVWAAYGGINRIDFYPDGSFVVTPLPLPEARREELRASLLLVFTGLSRTAAVIATDKIRNLPNHGPQLKRLRLLVDDAQKILMSKEPIVRLGELLHESWMLKRQLASAVTNDRIDEIYATARNAGATGGKLLGAGGGGFIALLVEPSRRADVLHSLYRLVNVDVGFDFQGSQLVVYEPGMEPTTPRRDVASNLTR